MADHFDPYHVWLGIPAAEQPPHHYWLLGVALFERDIDAIAHAADRQRGHLCTFRAGSGQRHATDSAPGQS